MPPTINDILSNPAQSRETIINLGQENQKNILEIDYLKERIALLTRQLYGRKSEKNLLPLPDQLSFLESQAEVQAQIQPEEIPVPAHTRRKSGRKPLPAELPRVEVIHDITDKDKICGCGAHLVRIGEETSEQLGYVPAKLEVIRHIRPKYACKACENLDGKAVTVKIAPVPRQIIPKSMASPSLLAHIITAKFVDALPFYRQEKQFLRLNIELSRTNMINWTIQLGVTLQRLLYLLHQELLLSPLVHIDETSLQVLKEPGRSPSSKSYMWVMRGDKSVYFSYSPARSSRVAGQLLEGYRGVVMSDGYAGYDFIARSQGMKRCGCWAHSRRKFVEAIKAKGKKSKKTGHAETAINFIGNLYQIERSAKERMLSKEELLELRQEKSKPLLDEFRLWLLDKQLRVPPKSLLGKAISYSLNQWKRLSLFVDNADAPLDNNPAENAIRPFVIGRKNWLFCDSQKGAVASAALYSLIETAKANNLNPASYLEHLFERLPHTENDDQLIALLPQHIDLNKVK